MRNEMVMVRARSARVGLQVDQWGKNSMTYLPCSSHLHVAKSQTVMALYTVLLVQIDIQLKHIGRNRMAELKFLRACLKLDLLILA
jgi:hypothetical protein